MFESFWLLTHIWTTKQQRNRRRRPGRKPPLRLRPVVEEVEQRVLLSDYYVSPLGNNGNSGTSPDMAWQTINRVNQQDLNPGFQAGDSINFQGGNTFQGSLQLRSRGMDQDHLITITSYGNSTSATIDSSTVKGGEGLTVTNAGWYHVTNINFVGLDDGTHSNSAIHFVRTGQVNGTLEHIYLDNVDVSGYGAWGILVQAGGANQPYNDVNITYAQLHGNAVGGLLCYGDDFQTIQNATIGHVQAYNNPGCGVTSPTGGSGHGIVLLQTHVGSIERCFAHDNGTSGVNAVGIWTADSDHITIQYNEVWGQCDPTGGDGDGFDLDGGTTDSFMQYNYSHENMGIA